MKLFTELSTVIVDKICLIYQIKAKVFLIMTDNNN